MIFAGLLFMEFCENFYKNLPNNIMTVLSDLTEKYTEEEKSLLDQEYLIKLSILLSIKVDVLI